MAFRRGFLTAFFVAWSTFWCALAQAADLLVFTDGPLQTAMSKIVAGFQNGTGHNVHVVYGTAPALRAKLQAGEQPDVLISLATEIDEMEKHNHFTVTERGIARVKLGLAVRHGVAKPDIGTLDTFMQTLMRADSIIHNSLASGLLFAKQLERVGIADQVRKKIVVIKGNTQLAELAKRKGNDVAAGQLIQLLVSTEVQFAGALPQEVQAETVYSAGMLSRTKSPIAARAFVTYLAAPKSAQIFEATGAR
jgi:molybdate transport system substrate-binding protein